MQKAILLICILINFWGIYLLNTVGLFSYTSFIFAPNAYYEESIHELAYITIALLLICIFCFKAKKDPTSLIRQEVDYEAKNIALLKVIYYLFIIVFVSQISLDNSLRGVGQFDVSRRGGLSGFLSGISPLAIAFLLFIAYVRPFNRNNNYIFFFILVMVISGLSNGGRRNIVYIAISAVLFLQYIRNVKMIKYLPWLGFLIPILLGMAILSRNGSIQNIREVEGREVVEYSTASVLQTNSDPSFLWGVKEYEDFGITLSPIDFLHHFTSLVMPSFVYTRLTGKISSYTRSVFIFDYWFNNNENQGWDFMTLADFYWCFGRIGYVLYILCFCWVLFYFSRNIKSKHVYFSASAILAILFFCQQRNDFGAILKPFVYTFIFLYILEKLFVGNIITYDNIEDTESDV